MKAKDIKVGAVAGKLKIISIRSLTGSVECLCECGNIKWILITNFGRRSNSCGIGGCGGSMTATRGSFAKIITAFKE